MPDITVEESQRQIGVLARRAEQAVEARRWDEAVERWQEVLAHPCAHHQVIDYEIFDKIYEVVRLAGSYDDAIAAKREAIAAGYRSVPDPEADIAECLLAAAAGTRPTRCSPSCVSAIPTTCGCTTPPPTAMRACRQC